MSRVYVDVNAGCYGNVSVVVVTYSLSWWQGHFSVRRAAAVLGVGTDNVISSSSRLLLLLLLVVVVVVVVV